MSRAADALREGPPPAVVGGIRTRLVTSAVLIPVFLLAVVRGRETFLAATMLLAGVAAWEFLGLSIRRGYVPRVAAGVGLALAFPAMVYRGAGSGFDVTVLVTAGVVGVALVQLFGPGDEGAIAAVSVTVFAALYAGLLFAHFVLLREIAREIPGAPYRIGAVLVGVPIVLTWINDTAAYVIGRRWGRRRLMPSVSPGKSVEGAAGALAATVLLAVPVFWLAGRWFPVLGPVDAVVTGALVGVLAPCGDLVESSFKRDAGVKDVSRLIPGHGGVLDRFDSLLLAVPAFYYYLHAAVL